MQPYTAAMSDRVFFGFAGLWFVAMAVVGFWESFYYRSAPEPLPLHRIVHGLVFSAWVLLFLVQSALISAQRVRWHKALGAAAIVLLIIMVPVGFYVVLAKTAAGEKTIGEAGFNLTELSVGFVLAAIGIANRKRAAIHKRLMLFATVMLTVAAADRVAMAFEFDDVRLYRKLLAVVPAIALVGYDTLFRRRVAFLSLALLTLAWLILWYLVSDLVFERPAGETIIRFLAVVFGL